MGGEHTGAAVVRGIGVVTPAGSTVDDLWAALSTADGTEAEVASYDEAGGLEVLACRARGFAPETRFGRHELRRLDRSHQMAFAAVDDALAGAGEGPPPERCAVVVGLGIGAAATLEGQYRALAQRGVRAVSPLTIPVVMPNSIAAHLSMRTGYRGVATTVTAACASGAVAIGEALWLLRTGRADRVVAGGVEAIHTAAVAAAFARMEAMSSRLDAPRSSSRPFTVSRDGFVLGEGAGFVVLERVGEGRGPDLGTVVGYGASSDAQDLVAPALDGRGAVAAMAAALADAGVAPADIGHVNTHGTSTPLNDAAEGAAIRAVFGARRVPVTATKSVIGHLIGAAGAVEAIVALLAARQGIVPPTANLDDPDPTIDVDVSATPVATRAPLALTNSFAFGGHNACLVVG